MEYSGDTFQVLRERFGNLTLGQQLVVRVLLDEPVEALVLSTFELGRRAGVSESTVVRTASSLGFPGFPELRSALHQSLYRHVPPSEQFRRTLRHEGTSAMDTSLSADAQNLHQLEGESVREAIGEAAAKLEAAEAVYIVGSHSSFAPAYELYYLLAQIRDRVHLVGSPDIPQHLLSLRAAAVVVVFSVPRYSRDTYTFASLAAEAGCEVVAVTDSFASPVAQIRSLVVPIACGSASFFHSQVASLAVANALVAGVAAKSPEVASRRLTEYERINTTLGRLIRERTDLPATATPSTSQESGARDRNR